MNTKHQGVVISKVITDSVTDKLGLKSGDVIHFIDDIAIYDTISVVQQLHLARETGKAIIKVMRDNTLIEFTLELPA